MRTINKNKIGRANNQPNNESKSNDNFFCLFTSENGLVIVLTLRF